MIRKALFATGVLNGATIDLVLDKEKCHPGDTITGKFVLKGGSVDQKISELYGEIIIKVCKDGKWETWSVHGGKVIIVQKSFILNAYESKEIEFEEVLPLTMPISDDCVKYYIETKLVIDEDKDGKDIDEFKVVLPPDFPPVFNAFKDLGYYYDGTFIGYLGQVFKFKHTWNTREVNVVFFPTSDGVFCRSIIVEQSRSKEEQAYIEYFIPSASPTLISSIIDKQIQKAISNPDKHRYTANLYVPKRGSSSSSSGSSSSGDFTIGMILGAVLF